VVTISAPADASAAVLGDAVTFAGSATDVDDGDLTESLSWESDLDGPIGLGAGFGTSALSLGTHTITASLTDAHGAPGSDQVTVTVNVNTPPVVAISAPADASSAIQGDAVGFAGTATDADDGDLTASLSWESSLDGTIGSGAGFSTAGLSLGTHTITASLTDAHGAPGSDQITVTINANAPPVVSVTAPASGGSAIAGQPIGFAGTATDAEDGDLTANLGWNSSIDGSIGSGGSFSTSGLSVGTHTITASVIDAHGAPGSDPITFIIHANTPPAVTITEPNSIYVEGTPVTFAATATDGEDGDLTSNLTWVSDLDGSIGSGGGFTTSGLTIGVHMVTASVMDSSSVPGSDQVAVTIYANTPPVVTTTAPASGGSAIDGQPVAFAGAATDVDDGDLTANLAWNSDIDGSIGTGGSFSTSGLTIGTHTITVSVSDAHGAPGSAQLTFTINPLNTAPVVLVTAPANGSSIPTGDPVTFAGTATDTEEGDLSANLAWISSRDGAIGSGGGFTTSSLSAGLHTITASLTDAGGLPGSDQISLVVFIPQTEVIFEKRIDASADDAEQGPRGGVSITGTDLELVVDKTKVQNVGTRFTGVDVPAGATILEAWVQFQADETGSGVISVTLEGEAVDDAAAFTTSNGNISSRPRTAASATWSPPDWPTKNDQGPDQQTSDISALIQEIVDRPGWSSGNALAIIFTGTGTRTAESYNGKPEAAPLLHIRYVEDTNTGPGVSIASPADGTSVSQGDPVTFAGTALDGEDGDLSASLNWDSDLDGAIGTGGGFTTSSLSAGLHTITASVTDSGGKAGVDQITLTVNAAAPPVVTITAPAGGSSATEGDSVAFAGTALDADDGDLTANLGWTSDLDGPIGTGGSFSALGLQVGTHTITASVTDSGGLPGGDQIVLTINTNTAPVVIVTAPADGSSAVEGTSVSFAGTAIDAEDGDLTASLAWTSDLDGPIGAGGSFSALGLQVGTHTITASVTDGHGLPGQSWITLTVNVNTAPVVVLTAPADGSSAIAGVPVGFSGTATDVDDGDLTASLSWTSDLDGSIGAGGSFSTTSLSVGLHTIAASVTDSGGLPGSDQITFTVNVNTPPVVTLTEPPTGTSVPEGDPITFSGTATDTEEGNLTANLAWTSDLDGSIGAGGGFSTSGLSPGTHTITASVTDSGGLPGSDQISLTVVANVAPVVTLSAPADGTSVLQGTSVTFAATATDSEDGDLTANLAWASDLDGSIGSGAGFSTAGLSVGIHTVTASVTDSRGLPGSDQITLTIESISPPVVFEKRVTAGADDAEEGPRGGVSTTGTDLELVVDQGKVQKVGVRFTGVDIPAGATILEAWVQFQADETGSGVISVTLEGEAVDSAAAFTSSNANISSRPRTAASTTWSPPDWPTKNDQGPDQQTSDISAVIQEIVDRPGWSSGNALAIIFTGTGTRTAESYNGKPEAAPLLHVLYQAP
jgi:hypothetical protein